MLRNGRLTKTAAVTIALQLFQSEFWSVVAWGLTAVHRLSWLCLLVGLYAAAAWMETKAPAWRQGVVR